MIEIENILNAAKGAAGATKCVPTASGLFLRILPPYNRTGSAEPGAPLVASISLPLLTTPTHSAAWRIGLRGES